MNRRRPEREVYNQSLCSVQTLAEGFGPNEITFQVCSDDALQQYFPVIRLLQGINNLALAPFIRDWLISITNAVAFGVWHCLSDGTCLHGNSLK